jgi:hypothetical protein
MAPPAPMAAVWSDKLYVDNDQIRDNTFDINDRRGQTKRNISGIKILLCKTYSDNIEKFS